MAKETISVAPLEVEIKAERQTRSATSVGDLSITAGS
jgi:hypothetical protein